MTDLDFTDHSAPYITGNGFASRCGRFYAWNTLHENPTRKHYLQNKFIYCKPEDIVSLFVHLRHTSESFDLLTHNSDLSVDRLRQNYLDDPRLKIWLAQNPAIDHPKLKAIPIGIANRQWPHGDVSVLKNIPRAKDKTALFHAMYSTDTDMDGERGRCLRATKIKPSPPAPFADYLRELSRACFSIAPRGRGIDTHRVWEALYMRTTPVVTRSLISRDHADFPMVVLDDWDDFDRGFFSGRLYEDMWSRFEKVGGEKLLTMDGYCARLKERYGVGL